MQPAVSLNGVSLRGASPGTCNAAPRLPGRRASRARGCYSRARCQKEAGELAVERACEDSCQSTDFSSGASTSGRTHAFWNGSSGSSSPVILRAVAGSAAMALCCWLMPGSADAMEEAPPGMFEFIMDTIEGLGPWGPAFFVVTVAACECIPLFPTQPFSLASGLLFGTGKGALLVWTGTMSAACIAFLVARSSLRPLADRIIQHELGGSNKDGPVPQAFLKIEEAIEQGGFFKQSLAIVLLRLTPIVPYSASNYLLGATHLPFAPYLAGSAAGVAFWSLLYSSLGGASRGLLLKGVSPDLLLANLLGQAQAYSQDVAVAGAVVAAGTGAAYALKLASEKLESMAGATSSSTSLPGDAGPVHRELELELEPTGKD